MNCDIMKNDPALGYPELRALESECFDEPFSEAQFKDTVLYDYFTARSGGVLAGFAGARVHSDRVHMNRLEVGEKFRRAGFGGALIDRVIAFARERAVDLVTLTVRGNNAAAYGLYTKKGFTVTGYRNRYAVPVGSLPDSSPVDFVAEGKASKGQVSFMAGGVAVGSGRFNYEIGGCRDFALAEPEKYLIETLASVKPHLKPGAEYLYIMTGDAGTIGAVRTMTRSEETVFADMELPLNR